MCGHGWLVQATFNRYKYLINDKVIHLLVYFYILNYKNGHVINPFILDSLVEVCNNVMALRN